MRTSTEIKNLIISFAKSDERIRAVLLNGSRANPNIKPDRYQDFDIAYIVTDIDSFTSNHNWTAIFGEKIISQLPDEMLIGNNDQHKTGFTYLMLFTDGNRIDLMLFPLEKIKTHFHFDSLTIAWLDKDNLFANIPSPNETDYLISKPTQKLFEDVCNEFWWVSTYVAKGLARKELLYAKEMLETVVRPMFMKLIEWHIGAQNEFSLSFGKGGKFIKKYLPVKTYDKILSTYSNADIENNWQSLFAMTGLFGEFARSVSSKLNFYYRANEEENVKNYLKQLHSAQ